MPNKEIVSLKYKCGRTGKELFNNVILQSDTIGTFHGLFFASYWIHKAVLLCIKLIKSCVVTNKHLFNL